MLSAEIHAIVSGGESDQVEFKASTGQRGNAARTVCGMLNGRGGFVLFGVSDDGKVTGQAVATDTIEGVVHELRRIEPAVLLEPEVHPVESGRGMIVVRVPAGHDRPYTYDGRPYQRQGPTTAVMPQEEYRRLLLEQMHPLSRWETLPAAPMGMGDLDHAEITRTVDEAIRRGRLGEPGTRDPGQLLAGLGLVRNGILLNAAVALFARAEALAPYHPQCVLRMARFRGVDKSEFIDNRQEVGNAFDLLARGQRFLRDHLPVAGRIVPGLFERVDEPIYPPEALREALANALCHREYGSHGGSAAIAIYDDRLEISSTGGLHFGLTVDDLSRPHISQPWNPLIASVFYRRGIIDQWGRGTLKVIDLVRQAGLVAPTFTQRSGELTVGFQPTGYVPPSRVPHELTPLQQEILSVLAAVGAAPSPVIRTHLTTVVSDRVARSNLQTLTHLRLVEKVGSTRDARWRLRDRSAP